MTDGGASVSYFFGAPIIGPASSFLLAGFIRLFEGEGSITARFRFADFSIDLPSDAPGNSGAMDEGEIDATELTISKILASGLPPDCDGETVRTTGIITAMSGYGCYPQCVVGGGDDATSDAIHVHDFSHGLIVGDEFENVAKASEYVPGGSGSGNQPTTEPVDVQASVATSGNSDVGDLTGETTSLTRTDSGLTIAT
ncbi:hypothetical protein [Tropicimonas aquimaris]|uniref:Uncharacterized protein n=1 Tax=Tropicimonas aquimaris TaxID=914152 RepID=A0ABW3IRX3_9RHOB